MVWYTVAFLALWVVLCEGASIIVGEDGSDIVVCSLFGEEKVRTLGDVVMIISFVDLQCRRVFNLVSKGGFRFQEDQASRTPWRHSQPRICQSNAKDGSLLATVSVKNYEASHV